MLPTEKSPKKTALSDQIVLLHGRPKIGKSTLCAQAPGALFLATEAGLNHIEAYQVVIRTWDDLLEAAKEIAQGEHTFQTVVIDTIDNAYRLCNEYICRKFKVEHASDLPYGKGFALVNNEFYRVLSKLSLLPYGLYLVSHSQELEIETRTGSYTKIVPTLPDRARRIVLGMVNLVLFCDLDTVTGDNKEPVTRRVLRTAPSKYYEAGHRSAYLPETIDLNYDTFAEAFAQPAPRNNNQPAKKKGSVLPQHAA